MNTTISTQLTSLTPFAMVQRMYHSTELGPNLVGEPRAFYIALQESFQKSESLKPSYLYSIMRDVNMSYNSFQKRLKKLTLELDLIIDPYLEKYSHSPQVADFVRSEIIRFGSFMAENVQFQNASSPDPEVSLFSDADVIALKAKNEALELQVAALKQDSESLKTQIELANEQRSHAFKLLDSQQNQLTELSKSSYPDALAEKAESVFNELFSIRSAINAQDKVLNSIKEGGSAAQPQLQDSIDSILEKIQDLPNTDLLSDAFLSIEKSIEGVMPHHQLAQLQSHLDNSLDNLKDVILTSLADNDVSNKTERVVSELFSIRSAINAQHQVLNSIKEGDGAIQLHVDNSLDDLKAVILTSLKDNNVSDKVAAVKEQIITRLNKMESSILDSTAQHKLNEAIIDIEQQVSELVTSTKAPNPLSDIHQSQVTITSQLDELSTHLQELKYASSTVPNSLATGDTDSQLLTSIDSKISALASHQRSDVDTLKLNKSFDYISRLVKDLITQNQTFEERVVIPSENISHLVRTNQTLTTKVEKISEDKRDALKQLSNMIKATTNTNLHKTSFTSSAAVVKLKSQYAKADATCMKLREERSQLLRQIDAKQKRIDKLQASVNA